MAAVQNGHSDGVAHHHDFETAATRFSDIPSAIDIPVSGLDAEEAVEVNLEDRLDDPTELCQLLENEKAAKNLWITIALAYAKQEQIDHAIEILNKGLASLAKSGPKERLSVLGCVSWLHLLKSRHAPRIAPDGQLISDAKTKDHYLREATASINEALRLNPAFPPLYLTRGVLFLLRASLQATTRAGAGGNTERLESLRQAQKCFEDASRASGGRNMMAIMGQARTQYLVGRYADALHKYQEVLGKMPGLTDPDPRIGVGCCLWQLGFYERARTAWERSLALRPDSKVAHALLGVYYLHESSKYTAADPQFSALYKKAMNEHTKKAYTIDKDFPLSCATFASYFLLTGRYDTVEPLARKAIEQTDVNAIASDGWYLLARKEHNVGDLQKAGDYYNRADQARGGNDKGYWPAKFGAIQIMVQMQDYDGAKFRLEKLLQTGKNVEATTLLACLYAEEVFASHGQGKEDKSAEARKAINLFESIRKTWHNDKTKVKPDESVLLYLARLYEADHPTESMKCLQQVEAMQLQKVPEEERVVDGEDEAVTMSRLRESVPPQLLNNMACFLYGAESFNLAQETFQIALNACVKLAEKQEAEKRAAEDEGRSTDDVDTSDTDALVTTISYNLARTYESLGLIDEAQKVYEGLLARHADYTDASARLAYIALRSSPQDVGPKQVQALYANDYGNLEVRALMGWYHSRSKRKTSNIAEDHEHRHYKHTLQNYDKHDKYSLTGMGNIYLSLARDMPRNTDAERDKRSKMYQKAVEFFDKALQLDAKNAYAAQGIGIALCDDKRDYSAAVQIFTKCKDTLRDSSIYLNLGHVYTELRQYQRAIDNYSIALRKEGKPDKNAPLLACLSRVWLLMGKADKSLSALTTSLTYMQQAYAAQPDSIHLRYNVAFIQFQLAQQVTQTSEANRTLADVESAAEGLEESILTFQSVSKEKNPPYPRQALEQRATMAKNTMRKQLERAKASQRDYEEKNAEKLKAAKERRDEDLRRKDEEARRRREAEEERVRKVAEERKKIIEETERMAELIRAEQLAAQAAEYTDDEEGNRVRRKERKRGAGGKRKKRDDDEDGFIDHDDDLFDGDGDGDGDDARSERTVTRSPESQLGGDDDSRPAEKPKPKRRKLERKSTTTGKKERAGKYKSAAVIVDSDSEDEALTNGNTPPRPDTGAGEDEDMPDPVRVDREEADQPRTTRKRKQLRTIADEEEESEDEDVARGDGGALLDHDEEDTATAMLNGREAETEQNNENVDIANAAMAAMAAGMAGGHQDEDD